MNPLDLILLQVGLEYRIDEADLLGPYPGSSEQAWYLVYQHSQGYVPYFSRDVPVEVRQKLITLGFEMAFSHPDKVEKLISECYQACKGGEDIFWSGYISESLSLEEYRQATREGQNWVIIQDGLEVCRAISVRQNEFCAEVYVETEPAFRRRGYGRQVVAAWAQDILQSGRIPFYSYRLKNNPSRALASSLGVKWYANVVAFEGQH